MLGFQVIGGTTNPVLSDFREIAKNNLMSFFVLRRRL
jgi:hypothetical protein